MKIWILGDTHLGYKNDDEETSKKMTDYLSFVIDTINKLADKDDIFIQLGDFFDRRTNIGTSIIKTAIELLKDIKIDTYILVGNHDTVKNDDHTLISTEFLKYVSSKIHIVKEPTALLTADDKKMLLMPYYTAKTAKEIFNNMTDEYDCMFTHLDFTGLKMNKYQLSDTCLDTKNLRVKKIFNGHIHLTQIKDNIINVGSAYELTIADEDNQKNLLIYDTISDEVQFIKNTISPRHIRIKYSDIDNIKKEDIKDNIIILEIKNSDITNIDNNKLTELGKIAYKVRTVLIEDDKEVKKKQTEESAKQMTFYDKVDTYINELVQSKIYEKEDAEKISKILKDTYTAVNS